MPEKYEIIRDALGAVSKDGVSGIVSERETAGENGERYLSVVFRTPLVTKDALDTKDVLSDLMILADATSFLPDNGSLLISFTVAEG